MAQLVAAGVELGIGVVFDISKVPLVDIAVDIGTRAAEERPDKGGVEKGGGGADAVQAGNAGAAKEVEEEGLDGVVAVVGCGHTGIAVLTAETVEPGVAQVACSLLDAHAVGGSIGTGVEIDGVESHSDGGGKPADKLLVTVAVAGAEMEVAMGYGKGYTRTTTEVEHGHRVAPAANGKQHLLPRGEEVLLLNKF